MKKNQSGFTLVEGMLAVLVVALISFAGWFVGHSQQNKKSDARATSPVITSTKQQAQEPATQTKVENGTITGTLGYPSSGNPAQKVCAVNMTSGTDVTCVTTTDGQNTYSITVKPASYYVYSSLVNTMGDFTPIYKAYYNEFSKCGNSVNCADAGHKQYIEVTVASAQTVDSINPTDWYAQ